MRVYIIESRQYLPAGGNIPASHISQEGYSSLEAAQAYIARKPGLPVAVTPMFYKADGGMMQYVIHDILIEERSKPC